MTRDRRVLDQSCRKGMHGTTLPAVPGIFDKRGELALAANSATMVDGILDILLKMGSDLNIIGSTLAHDIRASTTPA
eukprot:4675278-Pyramimonas_sp.AAC.1